jgi:hypothetical protein
MIEMTDYTIEADGAELRRVVRETIDCTRAELERYEARMSPHEHDEEPVAPSGAVTCAECGYALFALVPRRGGIDLVCGGCGGVKGDSNGVPDHTLDYPGAIVLMEMPEPIGAHASCEEVRMGDVVFFGDSWVGQGHPPGVIAGGHRGAEEALHYSVEMPFGAAEISVRDSSLELIRPRRGGGPALWRVR